MGQLERTGESLCPKDTEGRLCAKVISNDIDLPLTIYDLMESKCADVTPHIRRLGLKAYFGRVIRLDNKAISSLCVLFDR